jgi:hypothetical protein
MSLNRTGAPLNVDIDKSNMVSSNVSQSPKNQSQKVIRYNIPVLEESKTNYKDQEQEQEQEKLKMNSQNSLMVTLVSSEKGEHN